MAGIVVVGVDSSETAKRAAESARDLATALDATLHVVSAFENDKTEVFDTGGERFIVSGADTAEDTARAVVKFLGGGVTITYAAAHGRPAEVLVKEATRLDASVIVVGNRRMRGIGRVLGSIANSVAHSAPCDVYIANTYDTDQ